jgi:hypothetical protein
MVEADTDEAELEPASETGFVKPVAGPVAETEEEEEPAMEPVAVFERVVAPVLEPNPQPVTEPMFEPVIEVAFESVLEPVIENTNVVQTTTQSPARASAGTAATPVGRLDEPVPRTLPAWLPDPSGSPDLIRYWDGESWTSRVGIRSAKR